MFQDKLIRTNIRFIPNVPTILRFFRFNFIKGNSPSTHIAINYTFFGKGNPNESTPRYEGELMVYCFNKVSQNINVLGEVISYPKLNRSKKKYKLAFLNQIRYEDKNTEKNLGTIKHL